MKAIGHHKMDTQFRTEFRTELFLLADVDTVECCTKGYIEYYISSHRKVYPLCATIVTQQSESVVQGVSHSVNWKPNPAYRAS